MGWRHWRKRHPDTSNASGRSCSTRSPARSSNSCWQSPARLSRRTPGTTELQHGFREQYRPVRRLSLAETDEELHVSIPPLVEPAEDLTIEEVRRYSRHL